MGRQSALRLPEGVLEPACPKGSRGNVLRQAVCVVVCRRFHKKREGRAIAVRVCKGLPGRGDHSKEFVLQGQNGIRLSSSESGPQSC